MRRVSVVGSSGSGKTTLARELAARLRVPHLELDAVHHLPDWEPIDPAEFTRAVSQTTDLDGWVVDGNYRAVTMDGPVWQRADTVVFLDLPRHVVMRRLVPRTLRRAATGAELWNGNRERWGDVLSWDLQRSVIRWSWANHATLHDRYVRASCDPTFAHLDVVRLTSRREVDRFVQSVSR